MRVVERMRPGLGTFVTVHAEATSDLAPTQLDSAVDSAFHAIAQVDRLMGFRGRASDVGRLNRGLPGTRLRVHGWTYEVLREAYRLWQLSGGSFDCNVGAALMRGGLLPKSAMSGISKRDCPYGAAVELLPGRTVKLHARVALDLGGIAKGFAVDKAVEALETRGVTRGLINAGGDLRVFGNASYAVWVRDPAHPGQVMMIGTLSGGAIATSASYFVPAASADRTTVSAIVDPAHSRRVTLPRSVSVIARTCMLADALAKIAVLKGRLPARAARAAQASMVTV